MILAALSSSPNLNGESLELNGYGPVAGAAENSQWTTFGQAIDNGGPDPLLIRYDIDVRPGDSGAPVYTCGGFCVFCAAGIFTLGPGAVGPEAAGPEITSQVWNFLSFWSGV